MVYDYELNKSKDKSDVIVFLDNGSVVKYNDCRFITAKDKTLSFTMKQTLENGKVIDREVRYNVDKIMGYDIKR